VSKPTPRIGANRASSSAWLSARTVRADKVIGSIEPTASGSARIDEDRRIVHAVGRADPLPRLDGLESLSEERRLWTIGE
jgi:hypothetical protein